MKTFNMISVCLLAVFVNVNYAAMTGINIISQTNHVWGVATGVLSNQTYDYTSAGPVGADVSAIWYQGINNQISSAGDFYVYAQDKSCWTFTGSHSDAESTYLFVPLSDQIQMRFTGSVAMHSFENKVSFSLVDAASSSVVDSYSWATESSLLIDQTKIYSVTPGRRYSLLLHANVNPGDTPDVFSDLSAEITPEPAAILIFGLGGVILRLKKISA